MDSLISVGIALLTICNPIGNLAIFASLTTDRSDSKRLAGQAGLAISIIFLVVIWAGKWIMDVFGISTGGLEVAGGVIIAMLGLSMLNAQTSSMHHTDEEHTEAQEKQSIAVVPLAIPIVAGPGAMTTIILATGKFPTMPDKLAISAMAIAIAILLWVCFYFAEPISKRLGTAGMNVVTRIMGLVLAAIAFQMLANGLKNLLPGLA